MTTTCGGRSRRPWLTNSARRQRSWWCSVRFGSGDHTVVADRPRLHEESGRDLLVAAVLFRCVVELHHALRGIDAGDPEGVASLVPKDLPWLRACRPSARRVLRKGRACTPRPRR